MLTSHLTIGTIVLFLATIPELIALFISVQGYLRKKYPHFLFMSLTWAFMFIGTFLLTISYLNVDTSLYRFAIIANAPLTFSIMLLVDSISRQSIDPLKLFITTIVTTCLVIFAFEPNSVKINDSYLGEKAPALAGRFDIAGSLLFLLAGLFWLYYMAKIYLHAPSNIKRDAGINLLGAIIAGPGAALAFATGFVWILPGTDYACIAVGALTCSYAFMKQPKLGYVLPFKVYKLMAINGQSGLALYAYDWDREQPFDNQLFSAALFGISSILDESLGKGVIKEIEFEQGILLLEQLNNYPVFFVLVASESRPILKHALNLFSKSFIELFPSDEIESNSNVSKYTKATKLLSDNFPFVVNYVEN